MSRFKKFFAIAMILGLACSTTPAIAKPPKPTLAQIEAAKKEEAAKKAAAAAAAKKLAAATQTLRTLAAKARTAQALYSEAQRELSIARAAAQAAATHAKETAESVSGAHRVIGKLAVNAYVMGGSMSDIEPLLNSNGPQDLIDQISTLNTLGLQNSSALKRYKAAEIEAKKAKKIIDQPNPQLSKLKQPQPQPPTKPVPKAKVVDTSPRAR